MDSVLQLGRYDPLSSTVTTDHPCRDWVVGRAGFPPPPEPPSRRGGGGGDDHLPGRLALIVAQATVMAGAGLLGVVLAAALERAGRRT